MSSEVKELPEKYPDEIKSLFAGLRKIVPEISGADIEEKLRAVMPGYYRGECFVRLIPFKDHINIEARTIADHAEELKGYGFYVPRACCRYPRNRIYRRIFCGTYFPKHYQIKGVLS